MDVIQGERWCWKEGAVPAPWATTLCRQPDQVSTGGDKDQRMKSWERKRHDELLLQCYDYGSSFGYSTWVQLGWVGPSIACFWASNILHYVQNCWFWSCIIIVALKQQSNIHLFLFLSSSEGLKPQADVKVKKHLQLAGKFFRILKNNDRWWWSPVCAVVCERQRETSGLWSAVFFSKLSTFL